MLIFSPRNKRRRIVKFKENVRICPKSEVELYLDESGKTGAGGGDEVSFIGVEENTVVLKV